MFKVDIVTDVASELVTLSNVKSHLAITHTDDDTYLTSLITVVRKQTEAYCGISIGSQERAWIIDALGYDELKIPYGPVISVDDVKEKTDYGTYESLVLYTAYDYDNGLFVPFYNGRYKVEFTAGYTTLPANLKHGMLVQIAYLYENRNEGTVGFCDEAKDLVAHFRDMTWM